MQVQTVTSNLTTEEIAEAICALSVAQWNKLQKIARLYRRSYEAEDLLQEAFTRALSGSRNCPRDINILHFLAETMRSIASDRAKSLRRKPELKFADLNGGNDEGEELEYDPPETKPTAEQHLSSEQDVKKIKESILVIFKDDEIAQIMVEGIMEGMEGEELRNLTDLDKTAFNSKRRLISRRLNKAYPEGWTL